MHRSVQKVAVLGSGVMGSRIACHFANAGLQVLLLDIVTPQLNETDLTKKEKRNVWVNTSLQNAIKSSPSPLYKSSYASRISTGNFEDDLSQIATYDWIIEAVVENLSVKKTLFEQVEKYRKPGTLISSNTSGIPITAMLEGRSPDFCAHFIGTHFFNPPRYLKLFEIIPSAQTKPEVIHFFQHYALLHLGKTPVICKDTPAFIANRIGVFSMMSVFHLMQEMNLAIDEMDALTGTLIGRPKSASFRTADIVGLDTLVKVAQGVSQRCPQDENIAYFHVPEFIQKMVESNMLGDKSGQGFFKVVKSGGNKEIMVWDPSSSQYRPQTKYSSATLGTKSIEDPFDRLKKIISGKDHHAAFIEKLHLLLFAYCSYRIPEISDELYLIDDAMRAGFGWDYGPFQLWDKLGIRAITERMKQLSLPYASWVDEMLASGTEQFYKNEMGNVTCYNTISKQYQPQVGKEQFIILDHIRKTKTVYKNTGATILDIGDDVILLEFRTKMNAIGGEIIEGIHQAISLAEKNYKGLVIGNDAVHFSAGANLAMIFMLAIEQEFDELNLVVKQFQQTMLALRYAPIPVVAALRGMTLGGGCELVMHCDAAAVQAETYIGLVEVGAGLIPAGGGVKETALRISEQIKPGDPILPLLAEKFTHIATAKTSTSGSEGFDLGYLSSSRDQVVMHADLLIQRAKQMVIEKHAFGYTAPVSNHPIYVMGKTGLGALYAGLAGFSIGGYASEHDIKIAKKLAYAICGGDLSQPGFVSENYLLDLEREAFLSLLGERKTLERIENLLKTGKPLRN